MVNVVVIGCGYSGPNWRQPKASRAGSSGYGESDQNFDKGVELHEDQDRYKVLVQYRTGDLLVPKVDQTEALKVACT